ncbi:MAG: M28 family peptidase [Chitinophagaceae bacterium]
MARLRNSLLSILFLWTGTVTHAQDTTDSIPEGEVLRIMQVLAGDSLEGRGNFQPGLLKAAQFISKEFRQCGLVPFPGQGSYFIPFRPAGGRKNERADLLLWNGILKPTGDYIFFRDGAGDYPDRTTGYFKTEQVDGFDDSTLLRYSNDTTPILLWSPRKPAPTGEKNKAPETGVIANPRDTTTPGVTVKDTSSAGEPVKARDVADARGAKSRKFSEIRFRIPLGGVRREILMVYADTLPGSLLLQGSDSYYASVEYNVVAILPGKGEEMFLFSAHYDHEGFIPGNRDDNIMNGANDNASGTTGVLTLARAYALAGAQQRTLVFAMFAGEELGLTGSNFFTRQEKLDKLAGVINLEMIGVPQFGARTVFITGEYDSELPSLLGDELKANGLTVIRDPDPDKKYYERSDNYPFALVDIPAHSIMASTDDDECYHQFCDQLDRIDMPNLTAIINAIRKSVVPFVNGEIKKNKIK